MAGAFLVPAAAFAHAATVTADTTGADSVDTSDFWGINLVANAGVFLSQVVIDLRATNEEFDFDGSSNFNNATAPVITTLSGLIAGDVTFSFVGDSPSSLTIDFANGSFASGDELRFGADVDQIVGGEDFGGLGATITATLSNGASGSASFTTVSSDSSTAVVTLPDAPSAVPLPAGLPLLLLGVAGLAGFAKARRKF